MKYKFPHIDSDTDVRAAIAGREEFFIAERGAHNIFDYNVQFTDSFPNPATAETPELARQYALRRECRGLIVSARTGKPLARSYHKFFNVGERDETLPEIISLDNPHIVMDKMDGSMVRAFIDDPGDLKWHSYPTRPMLWGTRLGVTETAKYAMGFLAGTNIRYDDFALKSIDDGYTPTFEWCSRKSQIVLDYPTDRLVLTALRHINTGEYLSYEEMNERSAEYGVPVCELWNAPGTKSVNTLVDNVRGITHSEGVVVRFVDGHMVKVKGDWYRRIHKTKENLIFEKNVLEMVIEGNYDDVIAWMTEADRARFMKFADALNAGILASARRLNAIVSEAKDKGLEKRDFAAEVMKHPVQIERGMLFSIWEGKPALGVVHSLLAKHTSTQNKVDSVRHFMGDADWRNT